jgi:acyl-CoA thioesterase FadM
MSSAQASKAAAPTAAQPQRARPTAASELPAGAYRTPRQIRFSDCDPAGIVYTPRFVDLMNGVLEDFFPEALGLDYYGFIRDQKTGLGYVKVDCDFFLPGLMGDALTFSVAVERIGGASATFIVHGHRGEDEIVRGRLVMVTTSLLQHRAIPLPPELRNALVAYQDRCR